MGITFSGNDNINDLNKMSNELINVNFVQLRKNSKCNVTPEQFNLLLGLNVPKFSILPETLYPYLFCVSVLVDIEKICFEYGFDIGHKYLQKIYKNEYNCYHYAILDYNNHLEPYKLIKNNSISINQSKSQNQSKLPNQSTLPNQSILPKQSILPN